MEYVLIVLFYALAVRYLSKFGLKKPVSALAMCSVASFTLIAMLILPSLG